MYININVNSCNCCRAPSSTTLKDLSLEEIKGFPVYDYCKSCGYVVDQKVSPCRFYNWRIWKEEVQSAADWNREYVSRPNLSEYSIKAASLEAEYWETLSLQLEDQSPLPDEVLRSGSVSHTQCGAQTVTPAVPRRR